VTKKSSLSAIYECCGVASGHWWVMADDAKVADWGHMAASGAYDKIAELLSNAGYVLWINPADMNAIQAVFDRMMAAPKTNKPAVPKTPSGETLQ